MYQRPTDVRVTWHFDERMNLNQLSWTVRDHDELYGMGAHPVGPFGNQVEALRAVYEQVGRALSLVPRRLPLE